MPDVYLSSVRTPLDAHNEAMSLRLEEVVQRLTDLLGATAVAEIGGVKETRAVQQWLAGAREPQRPHVLRFALQLALMISTISRPRARAGLVSRRQSGPRRSRADRFAARWTVGRVSGSTDVGRSLVRRPKARRKEVTFVGRSRIKPAQVSLHSAPFEAESRRERRPRAMLRAFGPVCSQSWITSCFYESQPSYRERAW